MCFFPDHDCWLWDSVFSSEFKETAACNTGLHSFHRTAPMVNQQQMRWQRIGHRSGLEAKASSTDSVLQLAFQNILRWKDSHVLRHVYPGSVKLKKFDGPSAGTLAKDDCKWLASASPLSYFASRPETSPQTSSPAKDWPLRIRGQTPQSILRQCGKNLFPVPDALIL